MKLPTYGMNSGIKRRSSDLRKRRVRQFDYNTRTRIMVRYNENAGAMEEYLEERYVASRLGEYVTNQIWV